MQPIRDPIELSRQLVYFAAERTLSGWIRAALSLMALGFVIDRFDLVLHNTAGMSIHAAMLSQKFSTWGGSLLVGMGVIMAIGAGIRYLLFALGYRRNRSTDTGQGLIFGALFAFALGAFGIALLGLLASVL